MRSEIRGMGPPGKENDSRIGDGETREEERALTLPMMTAGRTKQQGEQDVQVEILRMTSALGGRRWGKRKSGAKAPHSMGENPACKNCTKGAGRKRGKIRGLCGHGVQQC
jgi:hypothetical protein